jgi:hypothetical protein
VHGEDRFRPLTDDEVVATLAQPNKRAERVAFAKRTLRALKRAGYTNQSKLRKAIQERAELFDPRMVRLSLPYWQQLYEEREDKIGSIELFERLLVLIRVLTPAYARGGLGLILDPERFDLATGVGPSCPAEMRLSMEEALVEWLSAGQAPRARGGSGDYAGRYEAYFPWLEDGHWQGALARAEARIYHAAQLGWIFESYTSVDGSAPLSFSGRLRFTGARSVVIIGFTSLIPTLRVPRLYERELLVHPHRLPDTPGGFWHGSTTFIDSRSREYAGTVGHIMRRISARVPDDADWARGATHPTACLRKDDRRYDTLRQELRRCAITR